jgi:hypothetical protein
MYVDESGDSGMQNSPSNYFALSALVIHETRWYETLDKVIAMRQHLKSTYGLKIRDEIHTAPFLSKPGQHATIKKFRRLLLLRDILDFQSQLNWLKIINVVVDKTNKPNDFRVFETAWDALFQRFENTLFFGKFPSKFSELEHGLVITDATEGKKLKMLLRRKRRYNPVPYAGGQSFRQLPIKQIVEDPVERDSSDSYLIQMADVNAFFLYQKYKPNAYIKKKGARNYFERLHPVLLLEASKRHPQGIVEI